MRIPKAHYNVILKPVPEATIEKRGSLVIPDMGQEKSMYAEVVDPGLGYVTQGGTILEPKLKKGDIVALPKMTVTQFVVDGQKYFACTELNIVAVITETE